MKQPLLIILLLLPLVLAASLNLQVQVPQWQGTRQGADARLPLIMKPGNPALPYLPVTVLLPMGETVVSAEVSFGRDSSIRSNFSLDYVRTPQPISVPAADNTVRNPAVWTTDAYYPAENVSYLGTQTWKGYSLAVFALYPWQYNPVSFSSADFSLGNDHRRYGSSAFVIDNKAYIIGGINFNHMVINEVWEFDPSKP